MLLVKGEQKRLLQENTMTITKPACIRALTADRSFFHRKQNLIPVPAGRVLIILSTKSISSFEKIQVIAWYGLKFCVKTAARILATSSTTAQETCLTADRQQDRDTVSTPAASILIKLPEV